MENRKKASVKGRDAVEIEIALDTAPRTVELPADLQKALDKHKTAKVNFEKLAPSKKKALVLSITEAKAEGAKQRGIQKAIETLQ